MDENTNRSSLSSSDTNHQEYRPEPGFNAYLHMEAIVGLCDALHRLLNEGPGTDRVWSNETRAAFAGLIWAQQQFIPPLWEWLMNIENLTTIHLPMDAEDFEEHHIHNQQRDQVKEVSALYVVN